eukprot:4195006-Prorocentrum_lima.AAC.1
MELGCALFLDTVDGILIPSSLRTSSSVCLALQWRSRHSPGSFFIRFYARWAREAVTEATIYGPE